MMYQVVNPATGKVESGYPTAMSGVTPDMRSYREELFGPAAVVYKVADADEAVELANSSAFGLAGPS